MNHFGLVYGFGFWASESGCFVLAHVLPPALDPHCEPVPEAHFFATPAIILPLLTLGALPGRCHAIPAIRWSRTALLELWTSHDSIHA